MNWKKIVGLMKIILGYLCIALCCISIILGLFIIGGWALLLVLVGIVFLLVLYWLGLHLFIGEG